LEEAIASFSKALQINPDFAQAHNNLGIALKDQNRLEEAIGSFSKALQIKPDYAEAHNNLGLVLQEQGRMGEAIASFSKALQIKPDYAEAHNNLGITLKNQNRLGEAIASLGKALKIKSDYAEAHNNLGLVLQEQGRLDEATASFGKALQIKPDYAEAHSNLCELFEVHNNIREFESALEKAILNCGEDNSWILCRLAQLASRKNQFEEAVGYLKKVQVERIRPSLKVVYYGLLGKACDKLGRFDEAFSAFIKQNELIRVSVEAKKFNADRYLNSFQTREKAWTTDLKPNWVHWTTGADHDPPTFLIGFPRSGTTLLDSILRSHPEINLVEEKPMVAVTAEAFAQEQAIQNLNTLSEADVISLRGIYFNELKIHLDRRGEGKLVVDRHPLNIIHVGLIHRVFPDAKFILALRHPCDCVLSCFMQTFKLNDAMANFLSLDQSARLYASAMELWSVYRQKLNLDVHVVKYEDLVEDLEGTCKPLIKFLRLEWDDNLHNYQKTALDRGRIKTASYSQVVQPLYKQAVGRWINYREQMEPVLPVLQPWIEAFGY
jgi:tetratricopeptide (TPR) repeat protein